MFTNTQIKKEHDRGKGREGEGMERKGGREEGGAPLKSVTPRARKVTSPVRL